MSSKQLIKAAGIIALVSFLGGTIIFGWLYFSMNSEALFFGYIYVAFTVVLNLGLLVVMLVRSLGDEENKSKLQKRGLLILVNIPIMFIYLGLTVMLLNRLRITITNSTPKEITQVKLHGCEDLSVENIKPGDSKNVWVYIPGDCSVEIEYNINGQVKTDMVAGYVTQSMGTVISYDIKP
ncbi:MAG TPA: hypothetical protein VK177_17730 [Flavobacteriales bacterium]|nr:hypothetical protein [Flavobacteriales bacterium]